MKYRSFGPLLLCGLALVGFRANSQNQTPSNALQPGRVSQDELNQLAKNLSANGLQEYVYRVVTVGGKGAAKMDQPRIVRGFFLMRQPEFMKPLPNGFFDDGIGDLVYFGKINLDGKTDVNYAITFAASGDVIAAFDMNNDGLADGILGRDSVGTSWSLNNKSLGVLQQCLESQAVHGVNLCVKESRRGSNPQSGPDSLGSFIDDLSKPDCNPLQPHVDAVRDPVQREVKSLADESKELTGRATTERRGGNETAAGHLDSASHHDQRAAYHLEQSYNPELESSERASHRRDYERHLRERDTAVANAGAAGGNIAGLATVRAPMPPPGTKAAPRRTDPRTNTRRPIRPDGENEDPRCKGQRTLIKQGLWFMSREYCPDRNFLDCWERAQDAVSEGTDGHCDLEPGPAGGQVIVCKREERKRPSMVDPSGEPPSPTDGPTLRFTVSPGVKLNYTFISTTQLGAMLGVLCQRDDRCGGMNNIQKRQATPN